MEEGGTGAGEMDAGGSAQDRASEWIAGIVRLFAAGYARIY